MVKNCDSGIVFSELSWAHFHGSYFIVKIRGRFLKLTSSDNCLALGKLANVRYNICSYITIHLNNGHK